MSQAPQAGAFEAVSSATPRTGWADGRGRGALAVTLVLLGVLLAPVAVVGGWARVTLTDTDRFVASYAPLADDPAVQRFLTDQVVTAVDQAIDVDQLTSDLVDGITALGTGPRATVALQALQAAAVDAVEQLVRARTAAFIASDSFTAVWRETLRISHTQALATLSGDPDAVLRAAEDGTLSIQLRPLVAAVRQSLVDQGFGLADRIPDIDRQVELTTAAALPGARLGYELVLVAGAWLAPVALALLAGGVLVARRRFRALAGAGTGLAVVMVLLVVALAVARAVAVAQAPPTVPPAVVRAFVSAVTGPMVTTAQAVAVLAAVGATAGWLGGPGRTAGRARERYRDITGQVRAVLGSGGAPSAVRWVGRQRVAVRVVVALGCALTVLLVRPLTVSVVVAVLLSALLAMVAIDLAAREEVRG